jgi:hypothetical protein
MKYELHQLEEMVAGDSTSPRPEQEVIRIKQVFTEMALSRKKHNILRRYYRFHRDGLDGLNRLLETTPRTQRKRLMLTHTSSLAAWMDQHLAQFLSTSTDLDPDDFEDDDIDAKKLITSFTLQELGVLLRLYIEAGVLRVRNQKAMSRFMSRYIVIRTRKVPATFSADHLYNAIHSPAPAAMNSLQATLNEMLTQLNKLRLEARRKEKGKK